MWRNNIRRGLEQHFDANPVDGQTREEWVNYQLKLFTDVPAFCGYTETQLNAITPMGAPGETKAAGAVGGAPGSGYADTNRH